MIFLQSGAFSSDAGFFRAMSGLKQKQAVTPDENYGFRQTNSLYKMKNNEKYLEIYVLFVIIYGYSKIYFMYV